MKAWTEDGTCVLYINNAANPEVIEDTSIISRETCHSQAVVCMKEWKGVLYTGSYDCGIKAWTWEDWPVPREDETNSQ